MNRRDFVKSMASAAAVGIVQPAMALKGKKVPVTASHLPRWRGFNLLQKFIAEKDAPYREADFELIARLGFDFVRLPMSYLCWVKEGNWLELREDALKQVDRAVTFGRKHGIHVNLNFHRAPGYCVNPPAEPSSLWSDEKALEACAFHWAHFAKRYKGIPNRSVSFNLLNEPAMIPEAVYVRVAKRLVEAIRVEDPERLIFADGLRWGRDPVHGLAELGIAQSTRGYDPMQVSHLKASWIGGSDRWPEPTWPLKLSDTNVWDKERLRKEHIDTWKPLEQKGVGIHVGEWGAYNQTPHRAVLDWMRDNLELWKEAGWGWALWNFDGPFGVLDSERADVRYENFHGHKLDREMLKLLKTY